jgi:23S rRNA pseudouridine1911/1915/1917 synthase
MWPPPLSETPQEFEVKPRTDGKRIDAYLASRFSDYSRNVIQRIIEAEAVHVNGRPVKASYKIRAGDLVRVWLPELPDMTPVAEDIPIEVVYEDETLTVVNKPPGMVTHPAKGNWQGTLVNALQFHYDSLSTLAGENRPGIVHRLDRDTTGLLVVVKNDLAHRRLALQFELREVHKEYLALVYGVPERDSDYVERPIGFHPLSREKMAIRTLQDGGKPAVTYYEVAERFRGHALVRCMPETGRTHQIRVHLAAAGAPVLNDPLYGDPEERLLLSNLKSRYKGREEERPLISRPALHASDLSILHPATGAPVAIHAPMPKDFEVAIKYLRKFARNSPV